MSRPLPSEHEVIQANFVLRDACAVLFDRATAAGLAVKPAPTLSKRSDADILAEAEALKVYHGEISAALAGSSSQASIGQSAATPGAADLPTAHANLRQRCAALSESLRQRSQPLPMPPVETGSLLHDFVALSNYHESLLHLNRKAGGRGSASASAAGAAAVTSPSIHVDAKLTPDEVAQMSWTERCQFAGGHLTREQVRAAVANRKAAKEAKGQKQNLTQRALAAKAKAAI